MRTAAAEASDTKKGGRLIRVSFPAEQIAKARALGKPEHANVAQICRRALEKELEFMQRQQSHKSWRQKQRGGG
jgi:hypothetical protein